MHSLRHAVAVLGCACLCTAFGCDFDLEGLRGRALDPSDGGPSHDAGDTQRADASGGQSGGRDDAGDDAPDAQPASGDSGADQEPDAAAEDAGCPRSDDDCNVAPALTELELSAGVIEPKLSDDVATYTIAVPLRTRHLTLTAHAPDGATIIWQDTEIVKSGEGWETPLIDIGLNTFSAAIQQAGRDDREYVFNVLVGNQEAHLQPEVLRDGWFGWRVAVDGDTAVVSAPGVLFPARTRAGTVFVYVRAGLRWNLQASFTADAPDTGDLFGASLAIDGDTLAVGASGEDANGGAVYVYTRTDESWSFSTRLTAHNAEGGDAFGQDVALADDTLIVGAPFEDSALLGPFATLPADDDDAVDSGAAYVFTRSDGAWTERAYLKGGATVAGDQFGQSVAIARAAGDGAYTLLVGAPYDTPDANTAAGSVYVFEGSVATWTQVTSLNSAAPAANGHFGQDVDVDGDWIVVGAPGEDMHGLAHTFVQRNTGVWQPFDQITPDQAGSEFDDFGAAVAISGEMLVVAAPSEDSSTKGLGPMIDDLAPGAGALYAFEYVSTDEVWIHTCYIKADPSGEGDQFGMSVALDGDTIVAGAPFAKVDGENAGAGAAYVIR